MKGRKLFSIHCEDMSRWRLFLSSLFIFRKKCIHMNSYCSEKNYLKNIRQWNCESINLSAFILRTVHFYRWGVKNSSSLFLIPGSSERRVARAFSHQFKLSCWCETVRTEEGERCLAASLPPEQRYWVRLTIISLRIQNNNKKWSKQTLVKCLQIYLLPQ